MSDFWPRLGWHVNRGEVDATVQLLHKATEEQRHSATAGLEAYVRKTPRDEWWSRQNRVAAVAVAAVGCMPSAAKVATLLGRAGIADTLMGVPVEPVVEIARPRGAPFMADLARLLAAQRREAAVIAAYELTAALVAEAGAAPPETDAFVRGWVRSHLFAQEPRTTVLDRLRDDPMLPALAPKLFEIDGIGTDLVNEGWQKQGTFPPALATLAEEGRLDRTMLLDGCVGRMLRGDRPGALRAFVVLLDQLAPTVDEAAARALDLVRLLPDAPSTVAGLAQRLVRQVDDAGRLELDTLLKVSEQVLTRTEKGLVKTQLRWLAAVAKLVPDRAGEIAGVVSVACEHLTDAAIQELARKLGGEPLAAPEPWVGETPMAAPVAAMPVPISSAGELAEEAVALFSAPLSVMGFERVLAGLVAVRATDPDGVAEMLTPILHRLDPMPEIDRYLPSPAQLNDALWNAVRTAAGATGKTSWQRLVSIVRDTIRGVARNDSVMPVPAPQRALVLRAGEICARLRNQPVPNLVATPTSVNGHLDAGTLVDRLAAAERDGWEPWRFDLEQALLRLPREVDADVLTRARKLRSAAGTRLADWLTSGGLPAPAMTRIEQPSAAPSMPKWRAVVSLTPGGPGSGVLADELCTHEPPKGSSSGVWMPLAEALWPAVLPGHRDVIAAWALPTVAAAADQDLSGPRELLPLLAECTGPVGPALTIALAYGLAARDTANRVAAVDAVLALTGSLDPVLLGQEVGAMAAAGVVKLGRSTGALTDAARGGARDLVRATVFAALPAVLAATPPPRGTPDLLALATETATTTGWRGHLPEVTELAGRSGKSRLHLEARRLAGLAGPVVTPLKVLS
jgi:hypothetical protein